MLQFPEQQLFKKIIYIFKYHINEILTNGKYCTITNKEGERNIAIVYSGGDDVCICCRRMG